MSNKNSRIWIVDDDLQFMECVKEFFESQEFQIETFESPSQLLHSLQSTTSKPHVILSDLHFPDSNGFDLIADIKKIDGEIPIIIMTGDSEVDTALKAIDCGAYDFTLKPLHMKKLLISVERAAQFHRTNLINTQFHQLSTPSAANKTLGLKGVIGNSPQILKVFDLVKRVAPSNATVCIYGESGSGKEVIARSIHELSPRSQKPFVAINCSAIPENLLETELFGHAKGAFTGAVDKKFGLFETAEGGTLFLDEIAELTLPLQAKLLRVIQERKIKRVGENIYRDIDVRIITATHRNMKLEVAQKRFRDDLYYRLNVIPINLPPLRERKEDIYPLANFFLTKLASINKTAPKKLSQEALQFLYVQEWKGNVRELENALERASILSESPEITVKDFMLLDSLDIPNKYEKVEQEKKLVANFFEDIKNSGDIRTLDEITDMYIQFVLRHTVGAREEAAKLLGIDRKTLYRRMSKYNLNKTNNRLQ